MCCALDISASGFYAWQNNPKTQKQKDDEYLLGFIKQSWLESGYVYGYRKVYKDLRALGELCGHNRVWRLIKQAGIQSQRGYKRKVSYSLGELSTVAPNLLQREFKVSQPDKVWVTDITYIRTYEGWLFLGVVIDFFHGKS